MKTQERVGEAIRAARTELGLSEQYCASSSGLTICEYGDVESNNTEFFDNISLGTARRLCRILGLEIGSLTAKYLKLPIEKVPHTEGNFFYFRHELISEARRKRSITEAELASAIGFEELIVVLLERTPDFIECLPIRVALDVAKALELDPKALIGN